MPQPLRRRNLPRCQWFRRNFTELAEKVRSGVVNIQVVKRVNNVAFGSRNAPEILLAKIIRSAIFLAHFLRAIRPRSGTARGRFGIYYEPGRLHLNQ